ncbi:hypothetical protein ACROSR_13520 [Roseovarius tibetensis]
MCRQHPHAPGGFARPAEGAPPDRMVAHEIVLSSINLMEVCR